MPEYVRALVYILVMAALVFKFSATSATAVAMSKDAFASRRNTWYFITSAGFLSQNIWIFYAVVALLVYKVARHDSNRVATFFFLILAIPQVGVHIPAVGDVNYQRVLVFVILVPIFFRMFLQANQAEIKWNIVDIILFLYFILSVALQFQYNLFTEWVRIVFAWFLDVLIPYFVISRSVKNIEDFREVVVAFIIGALVISMLGIFEFSKQWLLYQPMGEALNVDIGSTYVSRGDNLRAVVTTGQPIVLGYILAIAIGFYFYAARYIPNAKMGILGGCLLVAGILSPLSKGPWIGAVASLIIYTAMGPKAVSRIVKLFFGALSIVVLLMIVGQLDSVIPYLPFVGSVDSGNVDYRKLVFDRSIEVISYNPYFGSNDYLLYLEDLRQGQGIIDIVNNYIGVALNTGLVGLAFFGSFFLCAILRVVKHIGNSPIQSEVRDLGRALVSVLVSIMLMISSVSDINNVPLMYWSISALAVAYSTMQLNLVHRSRK